MSLWNEESNKERFCTDCISRFMALIDLRNACLETGTNNGVRSLYYEEIDKIINSLPQVKPIDDMSHWVEETELSRIRYKCYKCNTYVERASNFCPDCGARMV